MAKILIDIIAGVRPNFMKIVLIIRALEPHDGGRVVALSALHTGQHYDARMSGDFLIQLCIPEPGVNLEVGSGTQAEQAATIRTRYERPRWSSYWLFRKFGAKDKKAVNL